MIFYNPLNLKVGCVVFDMIISFSLFHFYILQGDKINNFCYAKNGIVIFV
ncbi:hypothetical protein HMPREF3220_02550 [Citrobacter koseri]|nr:hypothetical protein HMPREF3220_02550 [Citrobacter koseri]KWZ99442.1 hypothetical protein HMPREF3207_03778 [Citrobacter koseri]